jgi:NhaA family Na+:H+ antiporter
MSVPNNSPVVKDIKKKVPIQRFLQPFRKFAQIEAASGILMVLSVVIAMVWANSSYHESYENILHFKISFGFGDFKLSESLEWWINDFLMAIFFLLVGLEIKREIMVGQLSSVKKASLPVAAALGGMLIPAAIFLYFNGNNEYRDGWGIPMATDIAFSLGVLALVGSRMSSKLSVFLSAFAIADDIGAVLIIAIFYTAALNVSALLIAIALFIVLLLLNISGVRSFAAYIIVGLLMWFAMDMSGVHATIAGILLAASIPSKRLINTEEFVEEAEFHLTRFKKSGPLTKSNEPTDEQVQSVEALEIACESVNSPLFKMEHSLLNFVSYFIIPVFALANSGIRIEGNVLESIKSPLFIGIFLGLFVGKQIGVTLLSWLAVKLKFSELPKSMIFKDVWGVSLLGGIGFTMAIFVTGLAFKGNPEAITISKLAILAASAVSALGGFAVLSLRQKLLLKKEAALGITS